MLRTASSLPLYRASDAGLRPGPFPDRAASLLPGLLAATRTGLPPAGDDELTNSKIHHGLRHGVTSCSAGRTKRSRIELTRLVSRQRCPLRLGFRHTVGLTITVTVLIKMMSNIHELEWSAMGFPDTSAHRQIREFGRVMVPSWPRPVRTREWGIHTSAVGPAWDCDFYVDRPS